MFGFEMGAKTRALMAKYVRSTPLRPEVTVLDACPRWREIAEETLADARHRRHRPLNTTSIYIIIS